MDMKNVNEYRDSLRSIYDEITSPNGPAITSVIKRGLITGRIFIQNRIADDDSLNDLLSTMQNIYIGFILTAVSLNNVLSNKTLQKLTNTISTEKFVSFEDTLNDTFNIVTPTTPKLQNLVIGLEDKDQDDADEKSPSQTGYGSDANINKHYANLNLSSGRIIEVVFKNYEKDTKDITVNFYLQLYPLIVPNEVMEQFVALNFKPSFAQRWMQYSVGEIKFWRDLVFQRDLAKERNKARLKDKTGTLADMESTKTSKWLDALTNAALGDKKNNLANTILVYDKQSFLTYANKSGFKWNNPNNRQQFFDKTMSLMIALIDPAYTNIELYINGITNHSTYSYNQLRAVSKNDKYDLKDIMSSFGQGMAPRF